MEKLNIVVKLLEEKDVKILKLQNDVKESKEYFDKRLKEIKIKKWIKLLSLMIK